mmetsp:Transcript_39576/g.125523  ORF Transcript_39576/g.125523 Transcript_39576/m.125523 type:complete len:354 (-) Transcript_39576:71-1132(-)
MANRRALLRLSLLSSLCCSAIGGTGALGSCTGGDDSILLQMARSRTHMRTGESQTRFLDLVVERHCEDLGWLRNVSLDLRPSTRVLIYDKHGTDCKALTRSDVPQDWDVVLTELPNVARDGHDQLYHIVSHYDDLAPWTAFVQGGLHWTLKPLAHAKGWQSQAEALNDLVPKLSTATTGFWPLVMYSERGPMLWQDAEDDTDPDPPPELNYFHFQNGGSDMYSKARELYSSLFGGTPCEASGQKFPPGMQYLVKRENLVRRPLQFWQLLKDDILKCDPTLGYVFERVTFAIYNSTTPALLQSVANSTICRRDLNTSMFTTPLKPFETANFWREHWGCEPLSKRLLDLRAAGKI